MSRELLPCPLCGGTDITCFAEYDGDTYDNESVYRTVVGCLGCREEGCDPSYDEEPCFGIEAYFLDSHPLIRDCEDPSDCERVLERHMAERWNRRAERTCRMVDCSTHDTCVVNRELGNGDVVSMEFGYKQCSECEAYVFDCPTVRYCPSCGARLEGVGR